MTPSPENSTQALSPHRDRAFVLGEVHARPFRPIETPARLVHFAFQSAEPDRDAERRMLSALCEEKGQALVPAHARHHRVSFENVHLRWERHNEFTTYCWYYRHPGPDDFSLAAASMAPEMYALPQPGPHLVAVDLHIVAASSAPDLDAIFAKESLCVMTAEKGAVKGVFHTLHFPNDELAMSTLSPIAIVGVALFVRHRPRHANSAPSQPSKS